MSPANLLSRTLDEIVDVLGPVAARFDGGQRHVAVATGELIEVYEVKGARVQRVELPAAGTARRASAPPHGELRLPRAALQTHDITLPAATRGYVEPVLDHRLEKLTPWAPDLVIYGYKVTGETGDGSISVRFAATARDIAESFVAKAHAAGFRPTAIGTTDGPISEPIEVDLWRGARDVLKYRLRRGVVVASLVALLAPLPILAASIWTLGSAEDRAQSIEARSVAARSALVRSVGGGREAALIARKRPETALLTLIDRIATTLPDGTFLRELDIGAETVRLAGTSQAAPALLGLLSAVDTIADARFSAPVTRNPDGRDGFEIVANRAPASAPEAAPR